MYTPILLSHVMGCHGNDGISYNRNAFFNIYDNFFLHLNGPIEQRIIDGLGLIRLFF